MNDQLSTRDYQLLSDYLDGRLSRKEQARLEARLQGQSNLRDELEALRQTRLMLQTVPRRRSPRNFTLSPSFAPRRPSPRLFPVFRFASVLAGVLLVAAFLGDYALGGAVLSGRSLSAAPAPNVQPNYLSAPPNQATAYPPLIVWNGGNQATGQGGGENNPPALTNPLIAATPPSVTDQTGKNPSIAATAAPAATFAPQVVQSQGQTSAQGSETSTPVGTAPTGKALAAPALPQPTNAHTGAANHPSTGPILGVQPTESQGQIASTSTPAETPQSFPFWRLAEAGAGLLTAIMLLLAFYFYRKEKF